VLGSGERLLQSSLALLQSTGAQVWSGEGDAGRAAGREGEAMAHSQSTPSLPLPPSSTSSTASSPAPLPLTRAACKQRKVLVERAVEQFNSSPRMALRMLEAEGLIPATGDPLRSARIAWILKVGGGMGVSKIQLGEYLGEKHPENEAVLARYAGPVLDGAYRYRPLLEAPGNEAVLTCHAGLCLCCSP